ncbi:deoxyribonuclease IV [Eubacteriaceae bacterium ES2]|nr:deoxyribonuclease IV [Eubacteriaceae bacterium ES2]
MLIIGPHLSIAQGFTKAGRNAIEIGANTFQFFTRNPRGGRAKKLDHLDIAGLKTIMDANRFGSLLAHAPYTMNLASEKVETRDFARMIFKEDLQRLEQLPCELYNFHPGSHTGQGMEKGIELIVEAMNVLMWEDQKTTVLLETMSGKGTEIGRSFGELRAIINDLSFKNKVGVCLDTCHVFSGGYDIVGDFHSVLDIFDRMIGLKFLKAVHLNDSMMPFDSRKDRHQKLGQGKIGKKTFEEIVTEPTLNKIPFFLETPHESLQGYAEEIAWLRSLQ